MTIDVKGHAVLIDDPDFELVSQYTWHIGSTGYAVWRGRIGGQKKTIRMHRLITGAPDGLVVDHINHDRLDNRRSNLRVVTQSENQRNRTDQGKGYWYQRQNKNWVVEINGKHVGCVTTEEEAARVAKLVRDGGTYRKPERTHCKYGHSLENAYRYPKKIVCRVCLNKQQREYYWKKRRIAS